MDRRELLLGAAGLVSGLAKPGFAEPRSKTEGRADERPVRLFLAGDVMTGRGIDQVLPHPGDPTLHERWMRSAVGYVELAERTHGKIDRPVAFDYVWGEALEVWERLAPDARIVNLETAVTISDDAMPDKGIHYRMHPANVPCLTAADLDACALANNHLLDWGRAGLEETLATLRDADITVAGAGNDREEAWKPALLPLATGGRIVLLSLGTTTSGIPPSWAATETRPGVALLPDLSVKTAEEMAGRVEAVRRPGDVVVASLHWGPNWGWEVPPEHRRFARRLIDVAGAHVVHGHSSHHPLGIELHRGRPILYGCGDFLTDYEGISGHERYRPDLTVAWFLDLDPTTGDLLALTLIPFRLRRFRLRRAPAESVNWLARTLDRESRRWGARVREAGTRELIVVPRT